MLLSSVLLLGALTFTEAAGSDGCSKPFEFPAEAGGPSKGIRIGDRIVRISLPKHYKPTSPAPLILAYHDKGMSASDMEKLTRLSDPKLNADYIVVYPEAVESKWQSDEEANLKVDDKAFTTSLVDGLAERLCLDKDRIYATGMGTGAGLAHLMACDPFFSNNTAAFALINPTLLTGLQYKADVKDEITLLWEKCKPSRIPIKLLEVHGENNTLNSYWGKSAAKRGRMPTVQWLVEWAMRNECGEAKGMPTKDKESDMLYKTELASGTIYEGQIHAGKLQQAMYRCYALTPEEELELYISTFQVIEPNAKPVEVKKDGAKAEERGSIILEHLFVKNYGHGWPRIIMKDGQTETFETSEIEEITDAPVFDATKEILRWFNQHKLSDESREPNAKKNIEEQLDEAAIDKIVKGITEQVEKQKKALEDTGDTSKGSEKTPGEVVEDVEKKETVKDEL